MDVTLSRYVPPVTPRPRVEAIRVRCVIFEIFTLSNSVVTVKPSGFFADIFSTTGFDAISFHRVAVWSGAVMKSEPTDFNPVPDIRVHYILPDGNTAWPSFQSTAAGYNLVARVGFHVPSHMSGPFTKNNTTGFLRVEASEGVHSVRVEIDATFM